MIFLKLGNYATLTVTDGPECRTSHKKWMDGWKNSLSMRYEKLLLNKVNINILK